MRDKILNTGQKVLSKSDKDFILRTGKLPVQEPEYYMLNLKNTEMEKVILSVKGGCVAAVHIPNGIEIEVRDYDVKEDTQIDKEGNEYHSFYFDFKCN